MAGALHHRREGHLGGTFATKREAKLAGSAAFADAMRPAPPPEKLKREKHRPTLEEFAPVALTFLAAKFTAGTMKNHESNLRLHLLPTFGAMRLRDIRPHHVDDWWVSVPESSARRAAYFTLSRVMRLARNRELIKANPCKTDGASKTVARDRPELSESEAWRLVEALDPDTPPSSL